MNLNKVILIGRLTQDPEARTTPSGQNVTTVNMATNRVWNDATTGRKEYTEFHRIVAWGKLGDIASKYLTKGGLVMIEGRLQTRSWDDKQTGQKRYMTEIIAENLQMGPRSAGASQGSSSYEPGSYRHPAETIQSPPTPASRGSDRSVEIGRASCGGRVETSGGA